jgi:hypothetical protein
LSHSTKAVTTMSSDKGDLTPEPGSGDRTICSAASAENAHRTANRIPAGDERYFAANGEIGIVGTHDHHFWFKRRLHHQIFWLVGYLCSKGFVEAT